MRDDHELDYSPLSKKVTRDGVTVEVLIYRDPDEGGWVLEVVDHEGASTVWEGTFETDQEAWREVMRTIEEEGIRSFLEDGPNSVH